MKTTSSTLLAVLALIFIAESCGHTNNLKDFELRGKRMTFRSRWTGQLEASAHVRSPVDNPVADVAASIGSLAASSAAKEKLEKAAKPDQLAISVSKGTEEVLRSYLSVQPVHDSLGESVAIVETEIQKFSLRSYQSGIYADVKANTRMLSRANGKVIWEDCESVSVPLQSGVGGHFDPTGLSGIVNAAKLSDLSDEEIATALNLAAEDAGRRLGETLRQDIADLP